jgi:hypothetical protein
VVDPSGSAYVTGDTSSMNFPTTTGAFKTTSGGSADGWVTKINPPGTTSTYSTYLGGGAQDIGTSIAVDDAGSAYVTGYTNSTNFPVTAGAYETTRAGGSQYSAFVAKVNSTGTSLPYASYLGGNTMGLDDKGLAIAVDSSGDAFVTGGTNSSTFPTTPGAYQRTQAGATDAFVTEFNQPGSSLVFSTFYGSTGTESGMGIALGSDGGPWITGCTTSTTLPLMNPVQSTNAGGKDAYLAHFSPQGSQLLFATYLGGSQDDCGCAIALNPAGSPYPGYRPLSWRGQPCPRTSRSATVTKHVWRRHRFLHHQLRADPGGAPADRHHHRHRHLQQRPDHERPDAAAVRHRSGQQHGHPQPGRSRRHRHHHRQQQRQLHLRLHRHHSVRGHLHLHGHRHRQRPDQRLVAAVPRDRGSDAARRDLDRARPRPPAARPPSRSRPATSMACPMAPRSPWMSI